MTRGQLRRPCAPGCSAAPRASTVAPHAFDPSDVWCLVRPRSGSGQGRRGFPLHCLSARLRRMGAPSCDAETHAAYFHPIRPETWNDPIVGPVLRRLARDAPEVLAAVADVDRSLIFDALTWTPSVRLERALGMAAFIERTRGAVDRASG